MTKYTGAAALIAAIITISTGSALAADTDSGARDADAGSLGIVEEQENPYCLADAGSLGIPNPADVC